LSQNVADASAAGDGDAVQKEQEEGDSLPKVPQNAQETTSAAVERGLGTEEATGGDQQR
jgi:hypothetical protein